MRKRENSPAQGQQPAELNWTTSTSAASQAVCAKYMPIVPQDKEAVRLAVTAHVRHAETNYDELLLKGIERWDAREKVYPEVSQILDRWQNGGSID